MNSAGLPAIMDMMPGSKGHESNAIRSIMDEGGSHASTIRLNYIFSRRIHHP